MSRFSELERKREQLLKLSPVPADIARELDYAHEREFLYQSSAILEGSLTKEGITTWLEQRVRPEASRPEELIELRNNREAFRLVKVLCESHVDLSEWAIQEIHRLLSRDMPGDGGKLAGKYKDRNNDLTAEGAVVFRYCPHSDVPQEMRKLIEWYEASRSYLHPLEIAGFLHFKFHLIHPFLWGTDRINRLLLILVLSQLGYPPLIIGAAQREEYVHVLLNTDSGDMEPLVSFMARAAEESLDMALTFIKERSRTPSPSGSTELDIGQPYKEISKFIKQYREKAAKSNADLMVMDLSMRINELFNEVDALLGELAKHVGIEGYALRPSQLQLKLWTKNYTPGPVHFFEISQKTSALRTAGYRSAILTFDPGQPCLPRAEFQVGLFATKKTFILSAMAVFTPSPHGLEGKGPESEFLGFLSLGDKGVDREEIRFFIKQKLVDFAAFFEQRVLDFTMGVS